MKKLDSNTQELVKLLVMADDEEFVSDLLEDLFTTREIRDLASRLQVARMLDDGMSYSEIEKETKVSATTIARVSKCLSEGSGGYKKALEMLDV